MLFRSERVVEQGLTRLYSVVVRPRDATKSTEADLVFAGQLDEAGQQVKLFLLKGTYRYPSKGTLSELRRDYNEMSAEPFPVVGGGNSIPLDFPCLYRAELGDKDDSDGFWKEFSFYRPLLGEVYVHSVRQTVLFNTQKIRRPEVYKVALERKENQDVYLRLKPDNLVSRLVLNPWFPWPVFGESQKGRFWLIPSKSAQ